MLNATRLLASSQLQGLLIPTQRLLTQLAPSVSFLGNLPILQDSSPEKAKFPTTSKHLKQASSVSGSWLAYKVPTWRKRGQLPGLVFVAAAQVPVFALAQCPSSGVGRHPPGLLARSPGCLLSLARCADLMVALLILTASLVLCTRVLLTTTSQL